MVLLALPISPCLYYLNCISHAKSNVSEFYIFLEAFNYVLRPLLLTQLIQESTYTGTTNKLVLRFFLLVKIKYSLHKHKTPQTQTKCSINQLVPSHHQFLSQLVQVWKYFTFINPIIIYKQISIRKPEGQHNSSKWVVLLLICWKIVWILEEKRYIYNDFISN